MKSWKHRAVGMLLLTGGLLSGCSHQDFLSTSLTAPVTDAFQVGKPYVPRDTEAETAARAQRMAKVMEQWKAESIGPRDYHVGTEDILEIGVLALEEPGKVSKALLTVQSDGGINLPWVGVVKVGGLNLREVEARVRAALEGRFIKDPQITAAVSQYRGAPVIITGAVGKPGVYYLRSDASSILELLVEAGGLGAAAGSQMLLIRNRGTNAAAIVASLAQAAQAAPAEGATNAAGEAVPMPVPETLVFTNTDNLVSIDLKQLVDEGDLRLNLWVRGGDILNIPPKTRDFFSVLGYVNSPGIYEMDKDNPPGALQVIARAGGLTTQARAENSCLLRPATNGLQVIAVDLTKIARGVRPGFDIAPGDTLVVGSSFMARLSEFVRPSASAGVSASKAFIP